MKTPAYTALYLLLSFAAAYIAVVYLGMAGMWKAIFLIIAGLAFVGASAFTAYFSRLWSERGGQMATVILRNILGIPLWITGFVLAWLAPSPFLINPDPIVKFIGIILTILGSIPFVLGHIQLGWRTHMPSVKDTLFREGLYAHVRHPIYAGGFAILAGLLLIRPTKAFVPACMLVFAWLIVQARLEEIDLKQRMPDYLEYMRQIPRFFPRLKK